ncbi:MAG TPA: hypothetical protein VKB14_19330 [Actinomycetales bacterium]|nr:hypothetical protein [Actinomycetales bacterium]
MIRQQPQTVRQATDVASDASAWAVSLPLDGEPAPGREIRAFIRLQLQMEGLGDLADDVESVASELLRDAVERGASPWRLRLDVRPGDIVVALQERSSTTTPSTSEAAPRDIVDAMTAFLAPGARGTREFDDGREAWCVVARPGPGVIDVRS